MVTKHLSEPPCTIKITKVVRITQINEFIFVKSFSCAYLKDEIKTKAEIIKRTSSTLKWKFNKKNFQCNIIYSKWYCVPFSFTGKSHKNSNKRKLVII
jgi:hypothetical protein